HPDMRRYFMLIPEAVQLVLHAAALGDRGAVYVLEMGEQIKLVEMARNVIRLSGFIPDQEIPITFVGVRPGEKLYEELVGADETTEPSGVEGILRIRPRRRPEPGMLAKLVRELEDLAAEEDVEGALRQLCHILPTFQPFPVRDPAGQPVDGRQFR
ncbi:MAG: polysaccharide biosynthesis protein, partial [Candidatus Rokuibacteriota bacterium]